MASKYLMQIVDRKTGNVVKFDPGRDVEMDFVDDCTKQIMNIHYGTLKTIDTSFVEACVAAVVKRGVGMMRSQAHVEQDVRDGINEAVVSGGLEKTLRELETKFADNIHKGIEMAIGRLKSKVKA